MTREEAIESLERVRELSGLKGCRENIAINMAIEALSQPERPKGRWEEIKNAYGEIEGWICTCGREVKCKDNFCPNCGSDNRGEEE